jgi:predicted nuclease with TOPRIM domain
MHQGKFIGYMCSACYGHISTGKIGPTYSFLNNFREIQKMLPVVDGENNDIDNIAERVKYYIDETSRLQRKVEDLENKLKNKRNLMDELVEGIEFLHNQRKKEVKEEVKEELAYIQKPYSLDEILEQYSSGNYNAELLLQHALLLLLK